MRRAAIAALAAVLCAAVGAWWVVRSRPTVEPVTLSSGPYRLDATLYHRRDLKSYVVFCHGNRRGGRRHLLYGRFLGGLSRRHNVLAFDFRGFGRSTPLPPYAKGFTFDFRADVEAACDYLSRRFGIDPAEIVLAGHSFGSMQIINASKRLPCRLLVALGPSNFERIRDDSAAARFHLNKVRKNTGVDIPAAEMETAFGYWLADRLLDGVRAEKVAVVYGSAEPEAERLEAAAEGFRPIPESRVVVHEISGANHMYGTESASFWTRDVLSRFWIWRLVGRVSHEIAAARREPVPKDDAG